jgi:hypothetical protein
MKILRLLSEYQIKFIFILFFSYLFQPVLCQNVSSTSDSGIVVLYPDPIDKALMLLDGKPYTPVRYPFYLSIGTHTVNTWCPNYTMRTDTFVVKNTGLNSVIVRLTPLPAFENYRNRINTLRTVKYISLGVCSGLALSTWLYGNTQLKPINQKIDYYTNEMDTYKEIYDNAVSPAAITSAYNNYQENYLLYREQVDEYNKTKKQYLSTSLIFSGIGIGVFTIATLLRPKFKDTRSAFTAFMIIPENRGMRVSMTFVLSEKFKHRTYSL